MVHATCLLLLIVFSLFSFDLSLRAETKIAPVCGEWMKQYNNNTVACVGYAYSVATCVLLLLVASLCHTLCV